MAELTSRDIQRVCSRRISDKATFHGVLELGPAGTFAGTYHLDLYRPFAGRRWRTTPWQLSIYEAETSRRQKLGDASKDGLAPDWSMVARKVNKYLAERDGIEEKARTSEEAE